MSTSGHHIAHVSLFTSIIQLQDSFTQLTQVFHDARERDVLPLLDPVRLTVRPEVRGRDLPAVDREVLQPPAAASAAAAGQRQRGRGGGPAAAAAHEVAAAVVAAAAAALLSVQTQVLVALT